MFGIGVGIRVGGRTPVGGTAPYVGLLDTYPNAAAAYSVRLLKSDYTGNAIRVRRSSDNTEQNIGFDGSGNLDTTALTSFCSGTNGFVTTWYDQSGNLQNAVQTTAINQPQIVSAGSIVTVNSKIAMQFDATNDKLNIPTSTSYFKFLHDGNKWFSSLVNRINGSGGMAVFGNNSGTSTQTGIYVEKTSSNKIDILISNSSGSVPTSTVKLTTSTTYNINTQNLLILDADVSNATANDRLKVYINNSTANQGNTLSNSPSSGNASFDFQLATYGNNSGSLNGFYQEIVIWNSNQSSNKTGIESNINTYYGIY
jgi:hypothetical protein